MGYNPHVIAYLQLCNTYKILEDARDKINSELNTIKEAIEKVKEILDEEEGE